MAPPERCTLESFKAIGGGAKSELDSESRFAAWSGEIVGSGYHHAFQNLFLSETKEF